MPEQRGGATETTREKPSGAAEPPAAQGGSATAKQSSGAAGLSVPGPRATGQPPTGAAAQRPDGADAETEAIARSGGPTRADEKSGGTEPGKGSGSADDAKTAAIPAVSNPSDAATTILPVQKPGDQATEKFRTGGAPQGNRPHTDRVSPPPAGPPPVTRPPATPRPAPGPKNSGPHGPAGPPPPAPPADQSAGIARPPAPPRQAASAPSPADIQPTLPTQSLSPQPPRQQQPPQPRPVAPPQQVPPAGPSAGPPPGAPTASGGRNRRPLILAGAALVIVIAAIALVVALMGSSEDNSPEARVKAAVTGYADALDGGDLTELRAATCGPLHDFYQNIAPDQFAGVHKLSVDQRKVPKVDSVDSVQITGEKAVAQASVYTEADPDHPVARTFDLQQTPDGWKVCDPPNAAG
ncbi:hypothetical protein [Nocardia sp. BMG51109]|uniref:Rv0361 family membrane protein n=1 Tax=Nocardia sp. BMG51109 TaxID=1056816 RepID=UPI0004639F8A|nr:hypothetical protein [Nocardia sp. BMG51109]